MARIAVLGCGLVGKVMVRDLATDPDLRVVVHDVSEANLKEVSSLPAVETRRADLSSSAAIRDAVKDADAVVGAVPGVLGYSMLQTVIEAGKSIADISFAPEDSLQLDDLARRNGVTAVVDCGVSPGLSNLAIGRAAARLDEIDAAVIFVGGLPRIRLWPYEYRSVFSPTDVIEEYTRPARLVEAGRQIVKEALSDVELIDFPGVGTLEAFNTDGLRSLLSTVPARSMKEKTLRYPGHVDRMRMLRETGFFSSRPVSVDGVEVVPRRLTEKLLFALWRRPPDEEELTVMRVVAEGNQGGRRRRITFDLLDRTDLSSGTTSMARTTGYPCAIVARMLARGELNDPGVRPPELLARNEPIVRRILDELRRRGVLLKETEETLD